MTLTEPVVKWGRWQANDGAEMESRECPYCTARITFNLDHEVSRKVENYRQAMVSMMANRKTILLRCLPYLKHTDRCQSYGTQGCSCGLTKLMDELLDHYDLRRDLARTGQPLSDWQDGN